MLMDLDRFKQVNDSVGMAVGDSILLTLARRLGRLLKPQDTLARLSGDQFGIIFISEKDPNRIIAFAEACCKVVRMPITFNEREISLTASLGIAPLDAQTTAADELVKNAELAKARFEKGLATAKELGELVAKANTEAFNVLTKRVTESFEEIRDVAATKAA